MKTIRIYICLYFLLFSSSIHANNFLGGEVSYKLIDSINRIYKISFYLYRDCSGPKLNAPINIYIYIPGAAPFVYSIYPMPQPPTGAIDVEITPLCDPKPITNCTDTNSSKKGYTRNLYEVVLQTNTNFDFIDLNLNYCCRNVNNVLGSINTLDSSSSNGFFIYSTIETKWIRGNNAVQFKKPPILNFCTGSKQYYDLGAIEIDGDSVVYSTYTPLALWTNYPVIYKNIYAHSKPFDMVEPSIQIDNDGILSFTPTTAQTSVIGIKATEFNKLRDFNGNDSIVKIGETKRDFMISLNGVCPAVTVSDIQASGIKNASMSGNKNFNICNSGDTTKLRFKASAMGLPNNTLLTMVIDTTDFGFNFIQQNIAVTMFKDSNLLRDSVVGDYSFVTPLGIKKGNYQFTVIARYCINDIPYEKYLKVKIYVFPDSAYPRITISTNKDSICNPTGPITFVASIINRGPPNILTWYKNGQAIIASVNDTFMSNCLDNDTVWAIYTIYNTCTGTYYSVNSNKIKMTIDTVHMPSIILMQRNIPVCFLDTCFFNSTISNQGSSPSIRIYKNGNYFGTNYNYLLPGQYINGDTIYVEVNSSLWCVNPIKVNSNILIINATGLLIGTLNLSASKNKICKGDSVKLKAIPANGGTLPKYYWYNNAVLLDSNYSDSLMVLPSATSDYQCKMISNNNCTGTGTVSSNIVNIIVRDSVNTIVNITPTNPTIINGQSIKFTATLINGGLNPNYQWYLNNVMIPNSNKDTITLFGLKNGDSIYCIITPDTICLKTPQAISNKIQVNVNSSKIFSQRNNLEYQLYPNPTQGVVAVLLFQEQHGIIQWEILDLNGKKLNNLITINKESEREFSINLSQLKNGIYTMIMKFEGMYFYERIIKME